MTNKINLYIFAESGHAAAYGIGTYVRELTESLKDSDLNICVIHLYSQKPEVIREELDGVRHWYIPSVVPYRTELYYRNVVYLLQLLIKDTDRLVFHLNFSRNWPLVDELRAAFSCKIVFVVHLFEWCFALLGNLTQFRNIIANHAKSPSEFDFDIEDNFLDEKKFYGKFDKIICMSEYTKSLIQTDYGINPNQLHLILNGLKESKKTNNSKALLRKRFRILDNTPVILFVGKLDKVKGLDYVLSAFRIVLDTLPACRLLLVGSGAYDTYLKECKDIWMNIAFTGRLDKDVLVDLYSIADIGVMPSFHEQCSYAAIEMMMYGLPILGSTTTGLKEMIVDGETGLHIQVIEYDDHVEIDTTLLAEKMLYLLQNAGVRKLMSTNARKRYEQLYTSEIMRENMLHFYRSLFDNEQ